MYVHDGRARLIGINQWNGGTAPSFYLARTPAGNFCRFRFDVPEDLVEELAKYGEDEPISSDFMKAPIHQDTYMRLLSSHAPVGTLWSGPAYRFPEMNAGPHADLAIIDEVNAHLLHDDLENWLPDISHRQPFIAVLDNDRAVSLCASVRITQTAHEAGVETLPAYRRRGYAVRAISAWAAAVEEIGAMPFYRTSWGNTASRRVARALRLKLIGADFRIT